MRKVNEYMENMIRKHIEAYNLTLKTADLILEELTDLLDKEYGEDKRNEILNDLYKFQDFISYYPMDEKVIEKYLEKGK